MHIKICGITNTEDALQAVQAGATHLGLIFVDGSPRSVKAPEAQNIVTAVQKRAVVVGVFQNHSPEIISEIVVNTGVDAVQLHGEEEPAFCRSIALRLGKAVIKTIVLEGATNTPAKQLLLEQTIAAFSCGPDQVAYLLFDKAKGRQGSEWLSNATAQVAALEGQKDFTLPPYFFAGGLTAANLEPVLDTIKPFALDVASGVEKSPGKKDPNLVSEFIAQIRNKTPV